MPLHREEGNARAASPTGQPVLHTVDGSTTTATVFKRGSALPRSLSFGPAPELVLSGCPQNASSGSVIKLPSSISASLRRTPTLGSTCFAMNLAEAILPS